MKRTALVRRSPLARGKALARGAGRLRARRRPAAGAADQRETFKLTVCHEGAVCAVVDDGPCEGRLEAHHVVPQQWIRSWAPAERLAELLWDPRNGLAVCARHHRRHTLAMRRIPLAVLSPAHCEFIHELGVDHLIVRTYRAGEDVPA